MCASIWTRRWIALSLRCTRTPSIRRFKMRSRRRRRTVSLFDNKRLRSETFKLDVERMRRGWYSDKYFDNIVTLLSELSRRGYTFAGQNAALAAQGVPLRAIHTGDVRVEMQWFTRRQPF